MTNSAKQNRVTAAFSDGKAFIPFVTCGDPDLETTKHVVLAMARAGASIIELGIPFSDPTAEGPTIQDANNRALAGGVTTDQAFDLVRELRAQIDTPLVFMTYANVVFSYGTQRFCATAAEAGIDGLILPDVPFEEKTEFASACHESDLCFISLIAPTSAERIALIAAEAEGFVYCVSSLGVTGTRSTITTDLDAIVAQIRASTSIPIAIGFGIATPEAAAAMAGKSDGAIVGSAIVKLIARDGTDCVPAVEEFVRSCTDALTEGLPT